MSKNSFCLWLSGFFMFPVLLHAFRLLMGWELVVDGWMMTNMCSYITMGVGLLLSLAFAYCAGCCGGGKTGCCK